MFFSLFCYNKFKQYAKGTTEAIIRHAPILQVSILGKCRTLWGKCERAVTKSNLSSYSG